MVVDTVLRSFVSRCNSRNRRIQGQVTALEKALLDGSECTAVLTQIVAVRGAIQGLMIEVMDDHLCEHISAEDDAAQRDSEVTAVIAILRSYFR